MKNSKIKIIISKAIKWIFRIFILTLAIYNMVYVIGHEYNKEFNIKIFGKSAYVVTEKAMEPYLNKNDIIITSKTKECKEDDVIVFYQDGYFKIRRIAKVNDNGVTKTYITKGDNYLYYDVKEISDSNIEGKIVKVLKKSGIVLKILQSKGLMIFNTVILLLIFLYNKKIEQKKRKRRERKNKYI